MRTTVDTGALQMVILALRRDAQEGRPVRGEMADALLATIRPQPAAFAPDVLDERDICDAWAGLPVEWFNPGPGFA